MGDFGLFIVFMVPPLLLGLGIQWWLKRTFAHYSGIQIGSGLAGAQVARQILDQNGLTEVPVAVARHGERSGDDERRK